jgi:hypothetical protein
MQSCQSGPKRCSTNRSYSFLSIRYSARLYAALASYPAVPIRVVRKRARTFDACTILPILPLPKPVETIRAIPAVPRLTHRRQYWPTHPILRCRSRTYANASIRSHPAEPARSWYVRSTTCPACRFTPVLTEPRVTAPAAPGLSPRMLAARLQSCHSCPALCVPVPNYRVLPRTSARILPVPAHPLHIYPRRFIRQRRART